MSLYGHTYINVSSLKRWVNSLNIDEIHNVDVGGYNLEIKDETKKILELQLQEFSECINQMKEGDDWRNHQGILNHAFYNAFFCSLGNVLSHSSASSRILLTSLSSSASRNK